MDKCPMTGLPCMHKKCIHVTDVVNYQATELKDMCILCGVDYIAAEGGSGFNPAVQEVFNIINTVIKDPNIQEGKIVIGGPPPIPTCPSCGHTIEDILITGKIGCASCYKYFEDELTPLIEKCQDGGLKHLGKKPKTSESMIADLETQLAEAIKNENYVVCAKLRDEIKRLKGGQ